MDTAAEYIAKTESAMRKLLEGIDEYLQVLRDSPVPVFITLTSPGPEFDREWTDWMNANKAKNVAAEAARMQFRAESFAMNVLCGAVLQVAGKGIDLYSTNTVIPAAVQSFVKSTAAEYCVGREVRGMPIGLIVYAGRNQHTHFDEKTLRDPGATVFERLVTTAEQGLQVAYRDQAFDLKNPAILSFAANVTVLLGWKDYDAYVKDMWAMLNA